MAIAIDQIRVGKRYRLRNYGESFDFIVEKKLSSFNFECKDLYSLEKYQFEDLVKYGKGKDYDLYLLE